MTDAIYQNTPKPTSLNWNTERLTAGFTANWRYLAIIFGALLAWSGIVQLVNGSLGGVGVDPSDRSTTFAARLTMRVAFFLLFFAILRLVQSTLHCKDQDILPFIAKSWRADPWRPARAFGFALLAAVSFVWLQTNFMAIKTAIPDIQPFYLDEAAREIDRMLFLGNDPYTLFGWLYDLPILMKYIDKTYTLWAAIIAGVWVYCFMSERMERARRYQYIIAMILLWAVAGNVLALILSSAGPCYYGIFTGDTAAYAPLIAQLNTVHAIYPLGAFDYQDILLQMHYAPQARIGGISAMPSLHVGTSFMLLILFWKTRIARELLIAFNITIYIGSIVLGWHYAIDGLIVIPVVFGCWFVAGKIAGFVETRSPKFERVTAK